MPAVRRICCSVCGSALLVAGLSLSMQAAAEGEPPAKSLTATTVNTVVDPMQEVTPERAAAAETFARLNHPDLAELLKRLKAARQGDYDNAIRALFRESERLAKLKGRDAERYALELEVWKISSRIQLAAARLAMEDSPELRSELLALVRAKIDARTALVQLDKARLAARISKLDADLAELQHDPTASAEQELDKLLKSAQARANQAVKPSQYTRPKSSKAKDKTSPTGDVPQNSSDGGTPSTNDPAQPQSPPATPPSPPAILPEV